MIGSREAAPLLLEGLRQLEYRGYDSGSIATVNDERPLSFRPIPTATPLLKPLDSPC